MTYTNPSKFDGLDKLPIQERYNNIIESFILTIDTVTLNKFNIKHSYLGRNFKQFTIIGLVTVIYLLSVLYLISCFSFFQDITIDYLLNSISITDFLNTYMKDLSALDIFKCFLFVFLIIFNIVNLFLFAVRNGNYKKILKNIYIFIDVLFVILGPIIIGIVSGIIIFNKIPNNLIDLFYAFLHKYTNNIIMCSFFLLYLLFQLIYNIILINQKKKLLRIYIFPILLAAIIITAYIIVYNLVKINDIFVEANNAKDIFNSVKSWIPFISK